MGTHFRDFELAKLKDDNKDKITTVKEGANKAIKIVAAAILAGMISQTPGLNASQSNAAAEATARYRIVMPAVFKNYKCPADVPPLKPVIVSGGLNFELGYPGGTVFQSYQQCGVPLSYDLDSVIESDIQFNKSTGRLAFTPQFKHLEVCPTCPYEISVVAISKSNGIFPSRTSQAFIGKLHVVDTKAPGKVLLENLVSNETGKLTLTVNTPTDNNGYGEVSEIYIAVSKQPISNWPSMLKNPPMPIYSMRATLQLTPSQFLHGKYTITLSPWQSGPVYVDSVALDARGNLGPEINPDLRVTLK